MNGNLARPLQVLGVPCVTYIWIESCCRANVKPDLLNLHPDYYLDRGV